jgi:hypothetical protein
LIWLDIVLAGYVDNSVGSVTKMKLVMKVSLLELY